MYTHIHVCAFFELSLVNEGFPLASAGEVKDVLPIQSSCSLMLTFLLKLKFCAFYICPSFGASKLYISTRPCLNLGKY